VRSGATRPVVDVVVDGDVNGDGDEEMNRQGARREPQRGRGRRGKRFG
jgi:hypothetical protein